MRSLPAAVVAACLVLVGGCSADTGVASGGTPSTPSAPAPAPSEEGSPAPVVLDCDLMGDEEATRLVGGKPTRVTSHGDTCAFETVDEVVSDYNVLWTVRAGVTGNEADLRGGLGVRADDARRVTLPGGARVLEVRARDTHSVYLVDFVDEGLLTVFVIDTLLSRHDRPMGKLVRIARGIADHYAS